MADMEGGLIPGFVDNYNDLFVGPCDPDDLAREVDGILAEGVQCGDLDDFDCLYSEWVEHFRDEFRWAAANGWPDAVLPPTRPPARLAELATWAKKLGKPVSLEDGTRIKRSRGGWIVLKDRRHALRDVIPCGWVDRSADPLVFPAPEEASAAYLRSREIAKGRRARRKAALERLGRQEVEGREEIERSEG
jgi:hypothetical protein